MRCVPPKPKQYDVVKIRGSKGFIIFLYNTDIPV